MKPPMLLTVLNAPNLFLLYTLPLVIRLNQNPPSMLGYEAVKIVGEKYGISIKFKTSGITVNDG